MTETHCILVFHPIKSHLNERVKSKTFVNIKDSHFAWMKLKNVFISQFSFPDGNSVFCSFKGKKKNETAKK